MTVVLRNGVGAGSIRVNRSRSVHSHDSLFPALRKLGLVTEDDVVVHGCGYVGNVKLQVRVLVDLHEAQTGPRCFPVGISLSYEHLAVRTALGQFSFVDHEIKISNKEARVRLVTATSLNAGPAATLAADYITAVLVRASGVAVAGLATVIVMTQPVVFRQALVAITTNDVTFAGAFAGVDVAAVTRCSKLVAAAWLAAVGVSRLEVEETFLASVASTRLDIFLAVATAGNKSCGRVILWVAHAFVQGATRITIARLAGVWIADVTLRVLEVKRHTLFTVESHGVVLAVVADTATHASRTLPHGRVKVALAGMAIAVTGFAWIWVPLARWSPRLVVVQIFAAFAVEAFRIVRTLALAKHHVISCGIGLSLLWDAATGMAIAGARSSNNHVVDGVIVLLLDLPARVQKVVTESVQFGEVYAQVGHLEQVLHIRAVRVVDVDVGRQHTKDDLSVGRGFDAGIVRLAGHVGDVSPRTVPHVWVRFIAVVCKVLVHLPRVPIVM